MPKPQNYSNHSRLVFTYHILTFLCLLALLVFAVLLLCDVIIPFQAVTWMFLLLILTIISIALHSRQFALRAQDRAIRAEENLRYFILTGKRLSPNITLSQIIALRFASDDEFVELVEKTLRQNLSSGDIKKSIKNWRPDYHRA